ncbi:DUF2158 domain-containing protein [Paracoccus thiocyanatus]|uniref:DUF2158 domain-containing protein n=1 Tax=Paracoccus thiocyanatus TaxID=34006 RepID=UPI0011C01899|nr:DUF2158 domain-containing protein [Paracoccus thiocyanatus]
MAEDYKIGDIVVPKGRSVPQMTVAEIDGERLLCRWFDGKNIQNKDWFARAEVSKPRPLGPMTVTM